MLVYIRSMRESERMLCRVGSGWCNSVNSGKVVSKLLDLLISCRACGVESACMSVESGKLKSPMRYAVHMWAGGKCFLMVLKVDWIR